MGAIRGTFRNGKVEFDTPPDWPEGKELIVVDPQRLVGPGSDDEEGPPAMMTEEEQGDDPESIAEWLTWFDALEPLILTPEDEERIRQAREEQKAFELGVWEERSRKLEKLFE